MENLLNIFVRSIFDRQYDLCLFLRHVFLSGRIEDCEDLFRSGNRCYFRIVHHRSGQLSVRQLCVETRCFTMVARG